MKIRGKSKEQLIKKLRSMEVEHPKNPKVHWIRHYLKKHFGI